MFENGNGNGMYMPVAPAYGGGGFGNGFGGDWGWIILLLLCGWGGMGMGGFGGWGGMMGLGYDFPWLLNGQNQINANTNAGFDHAATQSALGNLSTAVTSGFGDVQTALCGGFAGVTAAVNGAQNAIAQQLYTGQIADLERSFAAQTANTAGLNNLQSQLASCCCDNRLATESLRATVLSENCADRYEAANNTRDIIDNQTRGIQLILDKLCDQELQAERRENANLRTQLNMATLAASQTAQTAALRAGQNEAAESLYTRLTQCPIPSQPVYGSQPIFACPQQANNGCGCSGNAFYN